MPTTAERFGGDCTRVESTITLPWKRVCSGRLMRNSAIRDRVARSRLSALSELQPVNALLRTPVPLPGVAPNPAFRARQTALLSAALSFASASLEREVFSTLGL